MKNIKKILSLALALCMTCGVMATAACKKETNSSSSSAPAAEEAEFTLTVTDEESGEGLKGVEFVMYNYYTDDLTAEFVTDADGKASATVEYGDYYVEIDDETLPEGYHSRKEEWNVTIEEDGENSLAIELYYFEIAAPDGTAENPYPFIDVENETTTVALTLPANGVVYYMLRYQKNAKIVITSENVSVLYEGVTYTPTSGVVEFDLSAFAGSEEITEGEATRMQKVFAVTNTTNAELVVNAELVTQDNAEE